MHGSLVTSSLIRETTENESANEGYRFGQEEETYNIVAAHGQKLQRLHRTKPSGTICSFFCRFDRFVVCCSLFD
jgi:hypothetical protein